MTIRPHFFGPATGPLFGCYHAPASGQSPTLGVLLCNPMGHEYMACHRTIRHTAARLAQAGFAGFRFDFYGSGDSAGESSDGTPSRWLRDVRSAATELRAVVGTTDISMMGLRLGATLALWHLQEATAIAPRALVLWDPVIDGAGYVSELQALHEERFGRTDAGEVCGFPFGRRLQTELQQIDLLQASRTARSVLIVETNAAKRETERLAARLTDLGAVVERRSIPGSVNWHEPNKAFVPANVVQMVVSWLRAGNREMGPPAIKRSAARSAGAEQGSS